MVQDVAHPEGTGSIPQPDPSGDQVNGLKWVRVIQHWTVFAPDQQPGSSSVKGSGVEGQRLGSAPSRHRERPSATQQSCKQHAARLLPWGLGGDFIWP